MYPGLSSTYDERGTNSLLGTILPQRGVVDTVEETTDEIIEIPDGEPDGDGEPEELEFMDFMREEDSELSQEFLDWKDDFIPENGLGVTASCVFIVSRFLV